MIDDRLEEDRGETPRAGALDDQRRLLELQLVKVRNEAAAARLEARAAEIELMIRQLAERDARPLVEPSVAFQPASEPAASSAPAATSTASSLPIAVTADDSTTSFGSWQQVRTALIDDIEAGPEIVVPVSPKPNTHEPTSHKPANFTRVDAAQPQIRRPRFLDSIDHEDERDADTDFAGTDPAGTDPAMPTVASVLESPLTDASVSDSLEVDPLVHDETGNDDETRRGKPAAWLVSAVAHVVLLLILAAISLQTQRPRDQVALSATAAEANEISMETFTFEANEPEPEPVVAEPTPSETEYELSPVGEVAASDFVPDTPPAPPSPAAASLSSSQMSSATTMSLKSDTNSTMQFCGVEGGGNHFVYLVDSSSSMGSGFASARAELLASIDQLKPEQRFYVIFFDAESDYMRLSNANRDEPRSVLATPAHKAALKRWAMRITMDRGRAPYDPLRFALELKPDVIFLLSDGEFPQGIEDLLREENRVENLFGDTHPISIVHTIGYHSEEGESRMRRIAEQNQGQYRYIPEP